MFKNKMVSVCGLLRYESTIQCHHTRMEKRLAWKHLYFCTTTLSTVKFLYRVQQRKCMFFKRLVLGKVGVDDVGPELADSSDNAVSVAMAHWNS
jgi:hypothetical protein